MRLKLCTGLSKKKTKKSDDQIASTSTSGEGGFGSVYKGFLELEDTDQVVAIKTLNRNGERGTREFLVEVLMLRLLRHLNVVNLIGYIANGDQRMLVYEHMPLGSLDHHLHDLLPGEKALDWNTRMKIAAGAAKGLDYMHNTAKPPVIYNNMKSWNILLDDNYNPKLSDFGMARLVSEVPINYHLEWARILGIVGYCDPACWNTLKSDIYCFGVVLLELITGRKAFDGLKPEGEKTVIQWARPLFRDRTKYLQMADPKLEGQFPVRGMHHALAIAAMCVQEQSRLRPPIAEVAMALNYLASQNYVPRMRALALLIYSKNKIAN